MTQTKLTESAIEDMANERLEALGYVYLHGSVMVFDGPAPERTSYAGSCRFGRQALGVPMFCDVELVRA